MANYDIRPLQLRILKNLLAVDKVCKEHNLRYYIMAGTMLGAVRHKGFIPWDDDLDIGMPRADYDLLMANAKEWSSWIPLLCRKFFTLTGAQESIRKVMKKYDFDQCALVCDYDDGMKGIMSKDILGTPTPIRFEDEEVWGVQKYDAYLSQKYGDYMTIPKQSGQRQHNFHYLDLNKPYRNFEV